MHFVCIWGWMWCPKTDCFKPQWLARYSPESQRLHFKDRLHSLGCRSLVIRSLLGARSQQHKPPAYRQVPGAGSQASRCQMCGRQEESGRGEVQAEADAALPLDILHCQQSQIARMRFEDPPFAFAGLPWRGWGCNGCSFLHWWTSLQTLAAARCLTYCRHTFKFLRIKANIK